MTTQTAIVPVAKTDLAPSILFAPNTKALSIDTGKTILASLASEEGASIKAAEFAAAAGQSKQAVQTALIGAIDKAARADNRIKLEAAFSGDRRQQSVLNAAVLIAVGLKELVEVNKDTGDVEARWTKEAATFFEFSGDEKTPEGAKTKQRMGERNKNFSTVLKKAQQTVMGAIDMGAQFTLPKHSDVLMLTGPEVEKVFGKEKVMLNEQQGELKASPSYKTLRDLAANKRKAGTGAQDGKASASPASAATAVGSLEAFGEMSNRMITAINALEGTPSEDHVKFLRSLKSAVDACLTKAAPRK